MEVPAPDTRPAAAPPGPVFDAAAAWKAPRRKAGRSAGAVAQRRRLFAEAFLSNGHNAAQAAIAAGTGGKQPRAEGWKLLHNPEVRRIIAARAQKVAEVAEMTTETWAAQVRALVTSDIGALFDSEGNTIPVEQLPAHVRMSIASVKVTAGSKTNPRPTIEYRLWDKIAALEIMARHLGLFEKDNSQQPNAVLVKVELVG
jgi:phage terminase small subunit